MPVTASDIRGFRTCPRHHYLIPDHFERWQNFQCTFTSWVQHSTPIMEFTHEDINISLRRNGIVYLVVKSDCDHHNANIYAFKSECLAAEDFRKMVELHVTKHTIDVGKAELARTSAETVTCFITGKTIPSADAHDWRFTYEFDAYVSPEGQRLVANCPNVNPNDDAEPPAAELEIIYREWRA